MARATGSAMASRSTRKRGFGGPLGLVLLALGLGLVAPGCTRTESAPDSGLPPLKGPDDPWNLDYDFRDLVEDAKRKDTDAVLKRLEKYLLTREELIELFGPEAGEAAWAGYGGEIAPKLRAEAAQFIVDRVAEGYTEAYAGMAGPAYPQRTTRGDKAMLEALVRKQAIYSVWIRKPGDTLGLRLNGFLFHKGRWRALFKTYDFLPTPVDAAAADAGATPEPAGDAADGGAGDATPAAADAGVSDAAPAPTP